MITEKILRAIMPFAPKDLAVFLPFIEDVFASDKFKINTVKRQRAFIAQVAHESGSFNYRKEIASGAAYDTGKKAIQLGNTPEADGDGQLYKGRGGIQVTGKKNYRLCSIFLYGDERLLKTPELLEQPKDFIYSAAWFWFSNNLNKYADSDDFTGLTRAINGGTNGLEDRRAFWERSQKYML